MVVKRCLDKYPSHFVFTKGKHVEKLVMALALNCSKRNIIRYKLGTLWLMMWETLKWNCYQSPCMTELVDHNSVIKGNKNSFSLNFSIWNFPIWSNAASRTGNYSCLCLRFHRNLSIAALACKEHSNCIVLRRLFKPLNCYFKEL